ncbi:hypothetical protein GGX14DRAFT_485578 [Mycena pura]|uniref:Uncharacterized protein n=1 Tax=Mycena pura TaxID=153505 RepID=A0AAD6XV96_9AGAR|nr:hypothetical protein GGX14DRAFT_485578 [Mycena pura]
MQLIPILAAFLAASGAYAQSCTNVPSDVASQLAEMKAFNSRVPAPSTTSFVDCTTGKNLKTGIDAYRSALIADPASGCLTIYADTILTDGFNPQYTLLGKFVAACA